MSILERIRPDLAQFIPYASARRNDHGVAIKLNANESPWPVDGDDSGLNRYPSPQPRELVEAMATHYGTSPDRIWIGRGSDEAIDLLIRLFCRAGRENIVTLSPTFGMYRIAAQLQGAGVRILTLDPADGFALDADKLLDLVDDETRIVILCSPNNPTGTLHHACVPLLAERLADRALLLVDEAYIEYADVASAIPLIADHENLAVIRTLSKAHALAGVRIGMLFASPDLIGKVSAIAPPYPVPLPCRDLALSAFDPDASRATRNRVQETCVERERVRTALAGIEGVVSVWPSAGNYLLMKCLDSPRIFERLLAAGILVRDVSSQPGLDGCLRVSIGRPTENDALIAALATGCRMDTAA